MITAAAIVFFLSVGLMFHSYVLYPVILKLFSVGKKENALVFESDSNQLPLVWIVFAVYNEERVIEAKMESIFDTSYPHNRIRVYIGSDNSVDATNDIIDKYARQFKQLTFVKFTERNGKSNIINKLVKQINEDGLNRTEDVFVFTDANVIFTRNCIYELVKHFKNEEVAQVGANILNKGIKADGISFQEKEYIQKENEVKYLEGLNWGSMVGAFGACYAMRAAYWTEIPRNYLMEDFYLSMHILKHRRKAICELKAVCYEDVSNDMEQEFKRKTRIQAGNFQNLAVYWPLLFRFNAVSFCFFSHKVIRWLGPVFILAAYLSNICLLQSGLFFVFTFVLQNMLMVSPVIDAVLRKMKKHLVPLRFVSYFYLMNLALLKGFFMFLKGIETNTWAPTKRNIS